MSRKDDFFSEDDGSFGFPEDDSSISEAKESELKFTFDHTIDLQEKHTEKAVRLNRIKSTEDPCLALTEEGKQYLIENYYLSFTFERIQKQIEEAKLSPHIIEELLSVLFTIRESSDEIFKNIIESALEQSFQSGKFIQPRIIIILEKIDGSYSIKIKDNGTGFKQDYMINFNDSNNFDKFASEKHGDTDLGGIGQGMSQLKEKIIKTFSGTITISNAESGGAQINIILPKLPRKIAIYDPEDKLIARLRRGSGKSFHQREVLQPGQAGAKTKIIELNEDMEPVEEAEPTVDEQEEEIDDNDIAHNLYEEIEDEVIVESDAEDESLESEDEQSVAEMKEIVSSSIDGFFKRFSISGPKPQVSGQGSQQPPVTRSRICGFNW